MINTIVHTSSLRFSKSRVTTPARLVQQWVPANIRLCLLAALGLSVAAPMVARATSYYVDFSAGSDVSSGTSTATAWKHCPGDANATGTAAGTTLAAGDTVKFRGGIVYSGGFTVSRSGSLASPISYDGNSTGDWGTGKAVIDRNYLIDSATITLDTNISHIRIDGFELRNAGGYADDDPVVLAAANGDYGNSTNAIRVPRMGYGVKASDGNNTNIYLANLLVQRMGIWHSTIGWDGRAISGCGIWLQDPDSITITNCEITQCGGSAIELLNANNVSDLLITDCYIHKQITWAIDVAVQNAGITYSNVTVTKTRIIDLNDMGGGWTGTPDDPGGTGTTSPHMNYIFLRPNGNVSYWKDIFITRCFFGETIPSPLGAGGTATIFVQQGASANIFNNIFARAWSTATITLAYPTLAGMTQDVRIYNNTFQRGSGTQINSWGNPQTGERNLYIENNLIMNDVGLSANATMIAADDTPYFPKEMDHNLYWAPNWTGLEMYVASLPYGKFIAQMPSIGYETNGFYANPLLVDSTNALPALRDYRPRTNSPAIARGRNLSAYFNTDYAGNLRPASGLWTIGAFEGSAAQTSAAISIAPASQSFGPAAVGTTVDRTFAVQNAGSGTLAGSASVAAPFSVVSGASYSLGTGQSQAVVVRYSPTAAGTNSQTVTFTGGIGGTGAVIGSATSLAIPAISISPSVRSFGSLAVGTMAEATFTVQNVGAGTLSGAASVVLPFSIVSGGTFALAAGQSQTVIVRYSPTATGTNIQNVTFTGGGGASATVSGSAMVPAAVVSAMTQNGADVDLSAPGLQVYAGSVLQYSGSASDPGGYPLSWQWVYTLNGGSEVVVQNGSGTVAPVSFNYTAGAAGSSYLWKLRVSNGYSTAESTLAVGVKSPPPVANGYLFQAGEGVIAAPFLLVNGSLSQSVQTTDPAVGGRVAFTFTITNAGNYMIQALVNAPAAANNSFFVNIDAEPQAPTMIWDIPVTSGFEQRMVGWRGNGTDVNSQFVVKNFALSSGEHQLIIHGREGNVQLQTVSILKQPNAPLGLRLVGNAP